MVVMTDRLSEIGLSVLFGMLENTGSTGVLKLYKDERVAIAHFHQGSIIKCAYRNLKGIDALTAMIVLHFAMYSFIQDDSIEWTNPIVNSTDAVFIKGYALLDEIKQCSKGKGDSITKSNGWQPTTQFEEQVCDTIKTPIALDILADRYISKIGELFSLIKQLDSTNNLEWSNTNGIDTRQIVNVER